MTTTLTRPQWLATPARQRRLLYARMTEQDRADLRGLFTATTPGDNLPYPDDYNAPADSPAALRDLANATQTALNKRVNIAPTTANIVRLAGWQGATPQPVASKVGGSVVLRGLLQRQATLTVDANTAVPLGTVPAGYRPLSVERFPCAWSAEGTRRTGQVWVWSDGTLEWIPTVADTLVSGDWVSVSGIVYVT